MGSPIQKLMIAFKCYDLDDNQSIEGDEVKYVIRHVPLIIEEET